MLSCHADLARTFDQIAAPRTRSSTPSVVSLWTQQTTWDRTWSCRPVPGPAPVPSRACTGPADQFQAQPRSRRRPVPVLQTSSRPSPGPVAGLYRPAVPSVPGPAVPFAVLDSSVRGPMVPLFLGPAVSSCGPVPSPMVPFPILGSVPGPGSAHPRSCGPAGGPTGSARAKWAARNARRSRAARRSRP